MKSDEIDKIIAEALEADKQNRKSRHHTHHTKTDTLLTVRKVLNVVFMAGFVAAIIIFFALPEQKLLFYSVGFGALFIKIIEFFIRFML